MCGNTTDDEEVATTGSSLYKMRHEVIPVCFHTILGTLSIFFNDNQLLHIVPCLLSTS